MMPKQSNIYRSAYSRQRPVEPPRKKWFLRPTVLLILILMLSLGGFAYAAHAHQAKPSVAGTTKPKTATKTKTTTPVATTPSATTAAATTQCSANTAGRVVIVSITKRHLWACDNTAVSYDSPVITGMENLAADLTPTGTFHIYAKQTDLHLRGSDSTGSWDDPVSYWMPYLDNQYGTYGFHDATWRPDSQFGNVDPYSADGSHGCVELPLATAAWLYNWASVGTAVTVIS